MDQPDTVTDPTETTPEATDLTFFQRMAGVFFSPSKTFEQLDRKPDWLAPMILTVSATFVFVYLTLPITLPEQMAKQEQKLEAQGMNSDQIEKAMAFGEKIGWVSGLVGGVLGPVIHLLVITLFYWFVGNVMLHGQTTYLKMFSVCAYTGLINLLAMAIKLPLILVKQTADVELALGNFLPEDMAESLWANILQVLDLFVIWRFAVLAIGFSVLYKFTLEKAAWTMLVVFTLYAALALAFLQLTGA
jgi:hypothetical protein